MKTIKGKCPLCDKDYVTKNRRTRHHIYPKVWYKGIGNKVEICDTCHCEFNYLFPMRSIWSEEECLQNWSDFCRSKGKWIYKVYPELKI